MRQFITCDVYGKITQMYGSSNNEDIHTPPGFTRIEVPEGFNPVGYYVLEGEVVALPTRPSSIHVFNYQTLIWEDPRTLEECKVLQWEAIKTRRTVEEFGCFTYNEMVFDGDINAQRRLNSYISVSKGALASGTEFQANFILANNEIVTLTAQDFVALEIAKVSQVALAFDTASQLRLQIEAAQTIEDVLNVSWPV